MGPRHRTFFLRRSCLGSAVLLIWVSMLVNAGSREALSLALSAPLLNYLPLVHKSVPLSWVDRLLISEVCFDPFGLEPDGEWIELYNSGINSIDLSGYKLGDAFHRGDREGMMAFPAGSKLKPGGVIVIANSAAAFYQQYKRYPDYEMRNTEAAVPDMLPYPGWANRSIELTNSGDEVILLNPDDLQIDSVSWGVSVLALNPSVPRPAEGSTIERYPSNLDTDTAKDWRTSLSPNPGQIDIVPPSPTPTITPTPSDTPTSTPVPTSTAVPTSTRTPVPTPFLLTLLISEVMYDPFGQEPQGEWIELYNPSTERIYLHDFKIGDEEESGGSEGMLAFPPGAAIDPGQVIVIANQASAFFAAFHFMPDYEMNDSEPGVPNLVKYISWSSGSVILANTYPHDEVLILDGTDALVDALSWGGSAWAFYPPAAAAPEGSSLERYPPGQDTNSALDWRIQPQPNPGLIIHPTPTPTASPTGVPSPATSTPTPDPGQDTPTPTAPPSLVINEIHARPDPMNGDANGDGIYSESEDEFIEIINTSSYAVSLDGWFLSDLNAVRHVFPHGSHVPPGGAAVVFGGGEPQGYFGGSLVQVSSTGMLHLNDPQDTITLSSPDGVYSTSHAYLLAGANLGSITRSPDIAGPDPMIWHSNAPGSGGALFSPGTRVDGTPLQAEAPVGSGKFRFSLITVGIVPLLAAAVGAAFDFYDRCPGKRKAAERGDSVPVAKK